MKPNRKKGGICDFNAFLLLRYANPKGGPLLWKLLALNSPCPWWTVLLFLDLALVLGPCSCPWTVHLSLDRALVLGPCSCPWTALLSLDRALVLGPCSCPWTVLLSLDRALVLGPCSCPWVVSFPDPVFTDKGLAHFARNLGLPDLAGKE